MTDLQERTTFQVGQSVVVIETREGTRAVHDSSSAFTREFASAIVGDLPPLSGSAPPAGVVGAWVGRSNLTTLDGRGRPVGRINGNVTADAIAPCPEGRRAAVAGFSSGDENERAYTVELVDLRDGAVLWTESVASSTPFNGGYPWALGCADASGDHVVATASFASSQIETPDNQIPPTVRDDHVTFMLESERFEAAWNASLHTMIVLDTEDRSLHLYDPLSGMMPAPVVLDSGTRFLSDLTTHDRSSWVAVVVGQGRTTDIGGPTAGDSILFVDLSSPEQTITEAPQPKRLGNPSMNPDGSVSFFFRPEPGEVAPIPTPLVTAIPPPRANSTGEPATTTSGAIRWGSARSLTPLPLGTVQLAPATMAWARGQAVFVPRDGSSPSRILDGFDITAVAAIQDSASGQPMANDQFWSDDLALPWSKPDSFATELKTPQPTSSDDPRSAWLDLLIAVTLLAAAASALGFVWTRSRRPAGTVGVGAAAVEISTAAGRSSGAEGDLGEGIGDGPLGEDGGVG